MKPVKLLIHVIWYEARESYKSHETHETYESCETYDECEVKVWF